MVSDKQMIFVPVLEDPFSFQPQGEKRARGRLLPRRAHTLRSKVTLHGNSKDKKNLSKSTFVQTVLCKIVYLVRINKRHVSDNKKQRSRINLTHSVNNLKKYLIFQLLLYYPSIVNCWVCSMYQLKYHQPCMWNEIWMSVLN